MVNRENADRFPKSYPLLAWITFFLNLSFRSFGDFVASHTSRFRLLFGTCVTYIIYCLPFTN